MHGGKCGGGNTSKRQRLTRQFGASDLVARGEGMDRNAGLPLSRVGLSTAQVVRDRLSTVK